MGKYYKMVIDPDDNIHVIINKKGYGKDYHERKNTKNKIEEELINEILDKISAYLICVDERVDGYEVLNAIRNIIYNFKFK